MFILNLGHAKQSPTQPLKSDKYHEMFFLHLLEGKLLVVASMVGINEDGSQVRLVAARHVEDLVRIRHVADTLYQLLRWTGTLQDEWQLTNRRRLWSWPLQSSSGQRCCTQGLAWSLWRSCRLHL